MNDGQCHELCSKFKNLAVVLQTRGSNESKSLTWRFMNIMNSIKIVVSDYFLKHIFPYGCSGRKDHPMIIYVQFELGLTKFLFPMKNCLFTFP